MMKRLLLFLMITLYASLGYSQVICTQSFSVSGNDDDPTILTIVPADITCNNGATIQAITLCNSAGSLTSTNCSSWYDFDVDVDGVNAVANGCAADVNGTSVTGFTTDIVITSNNLDTWSDLVDIEVDLCVTYMVSCVPPAATAAINVSMCPTNFEVDVNVTALGDGNPNITDGTNNWPVTAVGVMTIGPFAAGSTAVLTLEHGTDAQCNIALGSFTYNCPPQGSNCLNPIVVGAIPFNDTGNTSSFGDNYSTSPCNSSYIGGDEVIYTYTPAANICVDIVVSGLSDTYSGVHILDGCPDVASACLGYDSNGSTTDDLSVISLNLTGGSTYFIVISSWPPPQSVAYTLDIIECPTCIPPTSLIETNITTTTADLAWTENGTATLWDIEYGPAGFTSGTGTLITGTTTNPHSIAGLSDNTAYDWYVRADCAGGDISPWSSSGNLITVPVNDDFANAISMICGDNVTGYTTSASLDISPTGSHCGSNGHTANNVWYSLVGTGDNMTADLCASAYDTRVDVYCDDGASVYCVGGIDDGCGSRSILTFPTQAANTYYIMIHGWNLSNGAYDLTVNCTPPSCTPPANNDCDAALLSGCRVFGTANVLTPSTNGTPCTPMTFDNSCATASALINNPSCSFFGGIQDVWFSFTATNSEVFLTLTEGTAALGSIAYAVYGDCLGTTELNCNFFSASGTNTLGGLTVGSTYYIQVWTDSADAGTFDLCLEDGCYNSANLVLTASSVSAIPVSSACDEVGTGWSYYDDGGGNYVFAVEWDAAGTGSNAAAKAAATISITVGAAVSASGTNINGGFESTHVMGRHWDVDLGGMILTNPVNVRFYYDPAEKTAIENAAMNDATANNVPHEGFKWFKSLDGANYNPALVDQVSVGQATVDLTGIATTGTENGVSYVQFTGITGFSGGTGADGSGTISLSPLPIALINFFGETKDDFNEINWTTATEINNEYQVIERSANGINNWSEVERVQGAGNSESMTEYKVLDRNPHSISYYRIKSIDFDETVTYSHLIVLNRVNIEAKANRIIALTPNPAKGMTTIKMNAQVEEIVTLSVTDISGKLILTKQQSIAKGINQLPLDLEFFNNGLYLINITSNNMNLTERLVVNQ